MAKRAAGGSFSRACRGFLPRDSIAFIKNNQKYFFRQEFYAHS
jgi:hypothetical protein